MQEVSYRLAFTPKNAHTHFLIKLMWDLTTLNLSLKMGLEDSIDRNRKIGGYVPHHYHSGGDIELQIYIETCNTPYKG